MARFTIRLHEREAEIQCCLCMLLAYRNVRQENDERNMEHRLYTNSLAGVVQNPPMANVWAANRDVVALR
jgi:hypothetical protein